jgi:hypothetical protein
MSFCHLKLVWCRGGGRTARKPPLLVNRPTWEKSVETLGPVGNFEGKFDGYPPGGGGACLFTEGDVG